MAPDGGWRVIGGGAFEADRWSPMLMDGGLTSCFWLCFVARYSVCTVNNRGPLEEGAKETNIIIPKTRHMELRL